MAAVTYLALVVFASLSQLQGTVIATLPGWLRQLPDGLDIQVDENVNVVQGEWTVMIVITEPQPPAAMEGYVSNLYSLFSDQSLFYSNVSEGWLSRLRTIRQEIENPRRWWTARHSPRRRRRGLVNVVGDAFHFLFGTATDDDVADVRAMVEKLANNQGRIVHQMSHFTTVINHTYGEIQANRGRLNLITGKVSDLTRKLNSEFRRTFGMLSHLRLQVNINTVISQLEDIAHRYVRAHEAWEHRKENLEAGRLTESILPPSILESILAPADAFGAQLIEPIQWYYEHATVIPIWTEEYLVYKTCLPVVAPVRWHFIDLKQWPMPLDDYQARLALPESVLRNTESGELDTSPTCTGARPRVCRRGLVARAALHPCLTRLLSDAPAYDQTCVVIFERRLPIDVVRFVTYNTFVLITNGTELALRCAGRHEQLLTIGAGVYELRLEYPCNLHGSDWILKSTFRRSVNLTLESREIPFPLNASITEKFRKQIAFDPFVFDLTGLDVVDRKPLTVDELMNPQTFQKVPSAKKYLWHLFWLVLLVFLGAGVAGRWPLRRFLASRSKPPEIEIVPVGSSGLRSTTERRASDSVFQFRASSSASN